MAQIEDAETTAFEHLDLVIQAFDKPAGQAENKEVGDFIEEVGKGLEKRLKAGEMLFSDEKLPQLEFVLSLGFG
jgi:hypothetical protein